MEHPDNPEDDIDFEMEHWKLDKLTILRNIIPKRVEKQVGYEHPKIQTFLKRAFTRNIFNIVRLGKSPFHDLIFAQELITKEDERDLFSNPTVFKDGELDWKWLDKKLKMIHEGPFEKLKSVPIHIKFDGKYVNMTRGDLVKEKPIKISIVQYNRAKSIFTLKMNLDLFHKYLFLISSRYAKIGSTNNHCSMPPRVIDFTMSKMELFGSPINTCSQQYCSPFYDIEYIFGSAGTFFNFEFSPGVYSLDPPYDDTIMTEAIKRAIEALENIKEITFICCIPVWDEVSQKKYNLPLHRKGDFKAFELAEQSGFLSSNEVLDRSEHPFYHYFLDQYIGVSHTHLLVLSNNNNYQLTARDIKDKWTEIVKESPRNIGR